MANNGPQSAKVNEAISSMFNFNIFNDRQEGIWQNSSLAKHLSEGKPIELQLVSEVDGKNHIQIVDLNPNALSTEQLTGKLNEIYYGIRDGKDLHIMTPTAQGVILYPREELAAMRDLNYGEREYGKDITAQDLIPDITLPDAPELPSGQEVFDGIADVGTAVASVPARIMQVTGEMLTAGIGAGVDGFRWVGSAADGAELPEAPELPSGEGVAEAGLAIANAPGQVLGAVLGTAVEGVSAVVDVAADAIGEFSSASTNTATERFTQGNER